MPVSTEKSWKTQLSQEFEQPYFEALTKFVKEEYTKNMLPQRKRHICSL